MSLLAGLLGVLFAALAQVAVLPAFSIFGVHPSLVLVFLVAWISIRGRREALFLIPAAGLFLGLLDPRPLGWAMLALSPLILMTEVRELRLVDSDFVPALLLVVMGTVVYELTALVSLAVKGESVVWLASVTEVVVPAAVANVLLLLPVYGVVRLASLDLRRPRAI